MIAPAMSTLYSLTPVDVRTRLLSATVTSYRINAGEPPRQQEIVPNLGELPYDADHEDRPADRQQNAAKMGGRSRAPSTRAALTSSPGTPM